RRAHIGTVIEVLIYPVEVEKLNERLAYPPILKDGAARVKDERIHAGGQTAFKFLLAYLAVPQGREVVSRCPAARIIFRSGVINTRLECFEGRIRIPEILIGDAADIVVADVHREITPPVIRVKAIGDALSRNGAIEEIGAAADGRIKARRAEIALLIDMLRDDRHQAEDQRYFTVAIRRKDELHRALADALDLFDLGVIGLVVRPALVAQRFQRIDHILDRDRLTIRKAGLRV